jgi:hypothetical protein
MDEQGFWKKLCRKLPRGDYSRIESAVTPGFPDVSYCVDGVEGMLELKYRAEAPKRSTTPVFPDNKGLRPQQVAWMCKRLRHGGRVFLAAGLGKDVYLIRMTEGLAVTFNTLPLPELEDLNLLDHYSFIEALKL